MLREGEEKEKESSEQTRTRSEGTYRNISLGLCVL